MKFIFTLIVLTIVTSSLNGEPYTFEADWHNYKVILYYLTKFAIKLQ